MPPLGSTDELTSVRHSFISCSQRTPMGVRTALSPVPGVLSSSQAGGRAEDRKSTRLNSSHLVISYAVFCLKKKNNIHQAQPLNPTGQGGGRKRCQVLPRPGPALLPRHRTKHNHTSAHPAEISVLQHICRLL